MTAAAKEKSGTHWRRIVALTLFTGLMLAALALANGGRAAIETPPPPSVWSDKADYAPGEQVALSGANWAPGESVHIRVNDDAGETWRRDVDVTAGSDGTISDQFNLPDWFVAQYSVTATGASSGTATWSFTDAIGTTTTLTSSLNPSNFGQSVTFTATVACNTSGCIFGSGISLDFVEGANSGCNGGTILNHTTAFTGSGNSRQATFTTSTLSAGTHPIRACFNAGDSTSGNNVQKSNSDPAVNQVVNGNAAPVCSNGSATTPEDTAKAITLSCTDADGNPLTYTIVSGPTSGSVDAGTSANRTYTPNANFNGSDSFTFKANDGIVDSNTATFNLTITEVNDAPTAVADSKSVAEDGSLSFPASDLTSNDSKGPANESGQTLTATAVSSTASTHGSVSLSAGTVTYTPAADFNGAASFSYTVQDNGTTNGAADPKTATGTVNVTVTEVNDAPDAANDSASVAEDGNVLVDALGNDSTGPANESGQTLTISAVGSPAHGTAIIQSGKVKYTPNADYNGSDSFTYTATDNGTTNGVADPKSDTAAVSVTVTEVNDAPTAVADSKSVAEDGSLSFPASDLTSNDSKGPANESGQTLTATAVSSTASTHGSVSLSAGTVTYTPAADFNGAASFSYTVQDNGTTNGAADPKTATGTVNVTVTEVNDAPDAANDSASVAEDGNVLVDALGNDSTGPANESGQTLTISAVGSPAHGTAIIQSGKVKYTPNADYNGSDSFTYTATDNGTTNGANDFKSETATVDVTVTEVNDDPTGVADSKSVAEDGTLSFPASDLTANDSAGPANESGQTLTVISVDPITGQTHGSVSLVAGTVTYTPDADFNGLAKFDYTVQDNGTTNGAPDFKTGTVYVNVTVTEVNDAPTANDDSKTVAEDGTLSFPASDLTANDSAGPANESGQTQTVTAVGSATHGSVSLVAGTITYTPDADYNGPASFHYTVRDNGTTNGVADPLEDQGTVDVTVTEVNDDPTAVADSKTVAEDGTLSFPASDLTANDSAGPANEGSQTLIVISVDPITGETNGTVSLAAGTVTYTPDADFNGLAKFNYTVQDNGTTNGAPDFKTGTVYVQVTVTEVNDAPTSADDEATVAEDDNVVIDVLDNDSAGPANESGQTLTVSSFPTPPAHGSAVVVAMGPDAGKVKYTPNADYNGSDSFEYRACDNGTTNGAADPLCDTAEVNVTVTEVNDAPTAGDDEATVAEDGNVLVDVLANDSKGPANESGQTLTISAVGSPAHGSAVIQSGKVKYTPAADYNGPDSFTYTITDDGTTNGVADPLSDTATVSVTVTEVNDAPTAVADSKTVAEDGTLSFPASDLTANDSAGPANEGSQTLIVISVDPITGETNGTVSLAAGTVTYTPDADFNGLAKFNYTVQDNGTTNGAPDFKTGTVYVQVTVTEVNDAPTATDDSKSVAEDGTLSFPASDLSGNDSAGPGNESGQTLTVVSVDAIAGDTHGSVSLAAGTVTYTPAADYNGPASFHYTVRDNGTTNGADDFKTDEGTVDVTVTEVNDAPTANDDSASVAEDDSAGVLVNVLGNDSGGPANESGQTLTISDLSTPGHGTVAIEAGKIRYTPTEADYNGADSFTYKITDNGTTAGADDFQSDTATVSVTVTEVNDPPLAVADTASVAEDGYALVDVLANDTAGPPSEYGQALTIDSVGAPSHGTAVIESGKVKYTPAANYNGSDSFTYTVKDNGTSDSAADPRTATALVSVTITEVNDKPTAAADSKSVSEDGTLSFPASDLTANDSAGPANESSQTLTVVSVAPITGQTHGTVSLVSGTVTYTPAANYNGPASFNYVVRDNGTTNGVADPREDTGTVNVTVNAVNDHPSITRDQASVSVNEGQNATNSGTFDDIDLGDSTPDHVTISASVGTVTQNNSAKTWSWSYVPPDGPSTSTVTVSAKDDANATASVTFTLSVGNVAPVPTWTSYSNILYGPMVFGLTGTWSGSFTDPGDDAPWTATFAWNGVIDTGQTKTFTSSDPKTFSVRPNFGTAGCQLTGKVTVTEQEGPSGTDTKTVSVGSGEFLPPMTNQPVTDKLKNGQVLPVKVRIADCNGNPISGLSPKIELKLGDLTSEVADNSVQPIDITNASSADTSGFMRAVDGSYMYNLRINVPTNTLNQAYTIVITPNAAGYPSGMTLRHKIVATK